jgi:uncharacterized membrane protein YdjX (TVP38/TMEM64 family)
MPELAERPGDRTLTRVWALGVAAGLFVLLLVWLALPSDVTAETFAAWFAPYRGAWYALPGVVLAFVVLELVLVPVLVLIAATGLAFGPWLGPLYAMAGCLASASVGFAIGRRVGGERVERLAGPRVARATGAMARHGIVAAFLLRKIPMPFTLANVMAGATPLRYRDFIVGTALGMIGLVVGLAGFGHHAVKVFDDPTPRRMLLLGLAVGIPLAVALLLNRALRPREHAA